MKTILRPVGMFLLGLFLFIGLPLLGWGIGDVSGFVRDPARLGYIVITVVLTVTALPNAGRDAGEGKKLVRRQKLALLFLQVLSLALVIVAPYTDRRGAGAFADIPAMRYAGLALYACGFLLAQWAQNRLNRQFSVQVTIQEDHRLITDGPYRFLRHPRYLGIMLLSAGIALTFRSWAALLLAALTAVVLLWRIHDEEALMREEFRPDWEAYCRRSQRLVPWVY